MDSGTEVDRCNKGAEWSGVLFRVDERNDKIKPRNRRTKWKSARFFFFIPLCHRSIPIWRPIIVFCWYLIEIVDKIIFYTGALTLAAGISLYGVVLLWRSDIPDTFVFYPSRNHFPL